MTTRATRNSSFFHLIESFCLSIHSTYVWHCIGKLKNTLNTKSKASECETVKEIMLNPVLCYSSSIQLDFSMLVVDYRVHFKVELG